MYISEIISIKQALPRKQHGSLWIYILQLLSLTYKYIILSSFSFFTSIGRRQARLLSLAHFARLYNAVIDVLLNDDEKRNVESLLYDRSFDNNIAQVQFVGRIWEKATRKSGLSDVNSAALRRRNRIVCEIRGRKFC